MTATGRATVVRLGTSRAASGPGMSRAVRAASGPGTSRAVRAAWAQSA